MSSVNCAQNLQECPYHARLTIEHESAELRLKKEISPQFLLDGAYQPRQQTMLYALFEFVYTPNRNFLALLRGATFGFLDTVLQQGLKRLKWRKMEPQTLPEISLRKMYTKTLGHTAVDTALKVASILALNSFFGLFNSNLDRLHIIVHVISQIVLAGGKQAENTAKFVAANRVLIKFDEMNHLFYHLSAEGKERVEEGSALDERRQKCLNAALNVAALRMDHDKPTPSIETANQDDGDDLVDAKTAARISAFFISIQSPAPKPKKLELANGLISIELAPAS